MLRQILNNLFEIMRPNFKDVPNNYLVFDLETTGFGLHDIAKPPPSHLIHKAQAGAMSWRGDFVTEIGYCLVKDSKPIRNEGFVLNWTDVPGIDVEALKSKLLYVRDKIEMRDNFPTGKKYHMSIERMRTGANPISVLEAFLKLLNQAREQQYFIVAFNGFGFDSGVLGAHFKYWLNEPFMFNHYEMFDPGLIVKGAKVGATPSLSGTLRDWNTLVTHTGSRGIKWSLERFCVPFFRLDHKYNLDMTKAHTADFDSLVTHHLVEELKQIAAGTQPEPRLEVE